MKNKSPLFVYILPAFTLLTFVLSGCVQSAQGSALSVSDSNSSTQINSTGVPAAGKKTLARTAISQDFSENAAAKTVGNSADSHLSGHSDSGSVNDEGNFSIVGTVTNGTGGALGVVNEIRLIMEDSSLDRQYIFGSADPDGEFHFSNVPYHYSWSYLLEMEHDGVTYRSSRIFGQNFSPDQIVALSFKVYDSTTDMSALSGERLHVLLNFLPNGIVHVTESFLITNPASLTVTPVDIDSPLLSFPINKDALNITYEETSDDQNLKLVENTLIDNHALLPGSVHQVMFEYDLPFSGERTFDFSSPVNVELAVILTQDQNNEIKCTGMHDYYSEGTAGSVSLSLFTDSDLPAGKSISLHCIDRQQVFPIILGGISVLCILAATGLVLNDSRKKAKQKKLFSANDLHKTSILDAIITLDDQLKAGEITAEVYRAKREELIRKLEEK